MSEEELAVVEDRAAAVTEDEEVRGQDAYQLSAVDVPRLVAEVRRLQDAVTQLRLALDFNP